MTRIQVEVQTMTYEAKLSATIKLLSEIFDETPPTTYLSEIYNALVILQDMYDAERIKGMKDWTPVLVNITTLPLHELLKIIDDGLCHGFEFQIDNGILYTRQA